MVLGLTAWTGGSSTSGVDTNSFTCALQTGTNVDRLIIVACDGADSGITLPSPWVVFAEMDTGASNNASAIIAYAAGNSDADVLADLPGAASEQWAFATCNGIDTNFATTPPVIGVPVASASVDPPNLDLGSSALTIWVAMMFNDDGRRRATAAPTNYSGLFTQDNNTSTACSISVATRSLTAQAENPGAFTTNGSVNAGMNTIGIRVGAAGGTTFEETMTGAATPSGVMLRQTEQRLLGSSSVSGAILSKIQSNLAGSITSTGSLLSIDKKLIAGTLETSGSILKTIKRRLLGDISPSGSSISEILEGVISRTFIGVLDTTGQLSRSVRSNIVGATLPSGNLVRKALMRRTGLVTPTGALTTSGNYFRVFTGMVTASGQLLKTSKIDFSGVINTSGVMFATVKLLFVGAITTVGSTVLAVMVAGAEHVIGKVWKSRARTTTSDVVDHTSKSRISS